MPSHTNMPSSFASAASGSGRDSRGSRGDGRGSGDWASRTTRSNGTAVLRRSSTNPFGQSSAIESQNANSESQSAQQPSYEQHVDTRYTADQLLDIYKAQVNSEGPQRDVTDLFMNNWEPGSSNGANGRGWGKSHDVRDNSGPDACWDSSGSTQPIHMEDLSVAERNLFLGDINSPLKPPASNKDHNGTGAVVNGRKTSITHGQGNNFGLSSPVSSRPSTRRQQTSDSVLGLGSPSGSAKFPRDDSSPYFARKFNENRDGTDDGPDDPKTSSPFGTLMRSNTAGSALGNGPASPWGPAPGSATMGSFGNFNLESSATPSTPGDKRPGFGSMRGESRLAHLMPKDSSEDVTSRMAERSWRTRPRTDTDPFADDSATGSAALGGGQDTSPPLNARTGFGPDTPARGAPGEFGMSDISSLRGPSQQTPQGHHGMQEPLSPSDTNPYRSPPDDKHDHGGEGHDSEILLHSRLHGLGGIPEHAPGGIGALSRGFPNAAFEGSDRSQNSSVGGTKGFPAPLSGIPSLSNLGGMGGWPTAGASSGTPDREHRPGFPGAFGSSLFGTASDVQSPGFGALGGMFSPGASGANTLGRGSSKLGSLFPAAMQAQMQGNENETSVEGGDMRQSSAFGAIGRNAITREDSSTRAGKSALEDIFPQSDNTRRPFTTSDTVQSQTATAFPSAASAQSNYQQSQASSDSASNQLPTAQQRMMVMPDRMRWVYLDPQGEVQGPWSGLEMHDWYKASFFTADLSVKKVEDTDFEPLGQLIRRIGNSREPFLVPQIGIPHGPAASQAGAPFTPAAVAPGNSTIQAGSVQPPFAGAFPSFGTTLTAEQQNNLERRKQEEQYLMARQREFLAQQQVNMRQMQLGGLPSSLHHHSSAHSLQSQPSFGSMTSPIGMPAQAPVSEFFDNHQRAAAQNSGGMPPDFFREEDLSRLSLQERQQLFGAMAPVSQSAHAQQANAGFGQQSDAQREDQDPQGFRARLREFEQLRAQQDLDEANRPTGSTPHDTIAHPQQQQYEEPTETQEEPSDDTPEVLSLTQQVQKAASAKQSPHTAAQPESPWATVDKSLPMPFPPPPQSVTPLPAPTAQRGRSNLPETLSADISSRSATPEVAAAAPSIAPWAQAPAEAPRGPSLREIQEAEAKKAAKAEEVAAALRRAALEQELKALSTQPAAPAPGLPTSSTWGASPTTSTPTPSVWSTTSKAQADPAKTGSKQRTLAEIQKEEERKKKSAAAAVAAVQPAQGVVGGKRYADLASKSSAAASASAVSGPWAVVGAGGKAKQPPTGPALAPAARAATMKASTSSAPRPATTTRSVSTSGTTGAPTAMGEFNKWVKTSLVQSGLKSDVNVDEFVSNLPHIPAELIAESVYAATQNMNGHDFAKEYTRRRKLADKGVVEPSNTGFGTSFSLTSEKSSGSGWNEVAMKKPQKEDSPLGFKVVNKKKGKK